MHPTKFMFPRNGTYCSVSSKHQPLSSYRVLVLKIRCCFNAKEPVSMHLRFFWFQLGCHDSGGIQGTGVRESNMGKRSEAEGTGVRVSENYTCIIHKLSSWLWTVHISVRVIPHIFPAWIGQFSNSRCFDKASVHTFTIWLFEWSFGHAQKCFIRDLCPQLPIITYVILSELIVNFIVVAILLTISETFRSVDLPQSMIAQLQNWPFK